MAFEPRSRVLYVAEMKYLGVSATSSAKAVSCCTVRSKRRSGLSVRASHTALTWGLSFAHSPCGPILRGVRRLAHSANIVLRAAACHRMMGVVCQDSMFGEHTVIAARTKFVFDVLFEPYLYPRKSVSGTLSNTKTFPPWVSRS